MTVTAGIDVGAIATKAVVVKFTNKRGEIVGHNICLTGADCDAAANTAMRKALKMSGLNIEDMKYVVGTGYGRRTISFANTVVSDITCHAVGAKWLCDSARTVIDIGGQDSKAISLDENGDVVNFRMNDKCAAGTGRFLEVMANALSVPLHDLGKLSLESKSPVRITSQCTVFSESEVISLIARGYKKEDIIAGLHESISRRVAIMARQVGVRNDIIFTGGVAKNVGMVNALGAELQTDIFATASKIRNPQLVGAIGAARIAYDKLTKAVTKANEIELVTETLQ